MTQFAPILPEIILTIGAVVLMMVAAFGGPRSGPFVSWAAVAVLIGATVALAGPPTEAGAIFGGLITADFFASFGKAVVFLSSVVAIIAAHGWFERDTEHGVEAALHGKALIQDLRREPRNRAFAFKVVKVAGDKLTRALAWLNLAESGKLFLVRGPWIDEFVDEVAKFPHGKHDDQIDAVSVAVEMLAKREFRSGGALIK